MASKSKWTVINILYSYSLLSRLNLTDSATTESDENVALEQALILVEILKTDDHVGKSKWRRMQYEEFLGPQPDNVTLQKRFATLAANIRTTSSMRISPIYKSSNFTVLPNIVTNTSLSEFHTKYTINKKFDYKIISSAKKFLTTTAPSAIYISSINSISSTQKTKNTALSPLKKLMYYSKRVLDSNTYKAKDPELSQAEAELTLEIGVDAVTDRTGVRPRIPMIWRGSTKIYMADSTRYPIPFPENHAFCYTNPKSALCRTII